ncbi:MAG: succinate dehydrogenase iron-sulfur subunit [Simkaniaceae bacterium]|nr:succinate dehydrogenase iron-sulfur subunit [Simkaniaceae bacterium]
MGTTFILSIYRGLPGKQYREEFELELKPFMNVISALMEIRKRPVTRKGTTVAPVVWEQGCLEEVCGSCSMLVNRKPRQACAALIQPLIERADTPLVTLAPLTKFPLVRDLVVDRAGMFRSLKRVKGWISADISSASHAFGERISQNKQETMYTLATCMTCGCCSEACPQVNNKSSFIGPAPISQARLFNLHPTGRGDREVRNRALMRKGGIAECGNAQNCVQVCPKEIPLTESIAVMGRSVTKQAFKETFGISEE